MLNNVLNKEQNVFNDPLKAQFYDKHYKVLLGLGILGAVTSLGFAFLLVYRFFSVCSFCYSLVMFMV